MITTSGRTHPRGENKEKRQKITIDNGDGDTMPLCWGENLLSMTG